MFPALIVELHKYYLRIMHIQNTLGSDCVYNICNFSEESALKLSDLRTQGTHKTFTLLVNKKRLSSNCENFDKTNLT